MVDMMRNGLIDAIDLITHSFPVADFRTPFAIASDRAQVMKAQLEFT